MARLAAVAMGEAKARAKDVLTRVQDALAVANEEWRSLEAEVTRLTGEITSLLLDLEASRNEVFALHSQVGKDKEAMVEDY